MFSINNVLNMRLIIATVLLFFLQSFEARSQSSVLTLEEAITTGLSKNFSIRISKNNNEISNNNNSIGNAGYLPQIGISSSVRESGLTTETTSVAGAVSKGEKAGTSLLSFGASLDWTLFDGFRKNKRNWNNESNWCTE